VLCGAAHWCMLVTDSYKAILYGVTDIPPGGHSACSAVALLWYVQRCVYVRVWVCLISDPPVLNVIKTKTYKNMIQSHMSIAGYHLWKTDWSHALLNDPWEPKELHAHWLVIQYTDWSLCLQNGPLAHIQWQINSRCVSTRDVDNAANKWLK